MIKRICISVIVFLSFAVSIYIFSIGIGSEVTKYGDNEVILFSIPFTLCIVNSNLLILPKLMKLQESFNRYRQGIESIFLSINLILFILHLGLLLKLSGAEVNLVTLVPLSVSVVLITTANTLPRFRLEINYTTSELTRIGNQFWNTVIRPLSFPMYIGGFLMLFCVFLPGSLVLSAFFTVFVGTLFISVFFSYRAYQSSKEY